MKYCDNETSVEFHSMVNFKFIFPPVNSECKQILKCWNFQQNRSFLSSCLATGSAMYFETTEVRKTTVTVMTRRSVFGPNFANASKRV